MGKAILISAIFGIFLGAINIFLGFEVATLTGIVIIITNLILIKPSEEE
jgi:hypothetical protein